MHTSFLLRIFSRRMLFPALVWSLFFLKGVVFLDPDFGWHIRMGTYLLTHGFPTTDPFSYTLPNFRIVHPSWVYDVFVAYLFPWIGMAGLSAIFAFLALGSLSVVSGIIKTSGRYAVVSRTPYFFSAVSLVFFAGVRTQVTTWFFFALLLRLLLDPVAWRTGRFFLPLLFLIWANVHGGFIAGIFTLFLVLVVRSLRLTRVDLLDVLVFVSSLLLTCVHPYGVRLYEEVWSVVSSSHVRWTIQEWHPSVFYFNGSWYSLLSLSLFFLWRYRKFFSVDAILVYCVWLLFALSSLRHIPLWVLTAYPLTQEALGMFQRDIQGISYARYRLRKAFSIFLAGGFVYLFLLFFSHVLRLHALQETGSFPVHALAFLRRHPSSGNVFSEYSWGGYMLWKHPEKTVFIDGRMPLWNDSSRVFGYLNIFDAYLATVSGDIPFRDVAARYDIDTVVWPVSSFRSNQTSVFHALLMRWGVFHETNAPSASLSLVEYLRGANDWHLVYRDDVAMVFRRSV